mgnify:FL=1
MGKVRVLDDRLDKYVKRGTLIKLQEYFLDATNGLQTLVDIANGKKVGGVQPTVKDMLDAYKLMLDKSLPSLQATHVTQDHVMSHQSSVNTGDLAALEAEFKMLQGEVGAVLPRV